MATFKAIDASLADKALDEAIDHHGWAADEAEGQVAYEHAQMMAWLVELRSWRKAFGRTSQDSAEMLKIERALRRENEKLRKLVAEMYPFAKAFLQTGIQFGSVDSKSYDWYLRMRELGIEVN